MGYILSAIILIAFLIFIRLNIIKNKKSLRLIEELKLQNIYPEEIFKNSKDGIVILDNADRIIKANESFQRIFQYNIDVIKGLNINDVVANSETKDAYEFSDIVMSGGVVNAESKRKRKDGVFIDTNIVSFPLVLDTDQIGICVIYKDIRYEKVSEKELKLQRIYFSQLFENSPEAICIIDTEDRFIDVNGAYEKLFGFTKEELINHKINDRIVQPHSLDEATRISENVMKGNIIELEAMRMRKNGSLVDVHILGYPIFLEDKQIGVFGIYKDITERKQSEEAIKASEYTFRTLFESSSDAILILENNIVIDCNMAIVELLGYDSKVDIIGKSLWEFSPEIQPDGEFSEEKNLEIIKINEEKKKSKFEWWYQKSDGTLIPVEVMLTSILLNGKEVLHALCRDVGARMQMAQKLEFLSYHDQLTGLYNRRFYEEELKRLDTERNLPLTIVMGDVNGLKLINDSFGHVMGDSLLKKVAEVIKSECRADDIIARLGGDEFVIILPQTGTLETEHIIKRITDRALSEKQDSIDVSISFGYGTKKIGEEKIQEIFKNAEDQMYRKKLVESPRMRENTISAIISTLHEKNKREEQHSHRVSALCKEMGEALGLPENKIEELKVVGLLHDIGKIAIDENILNKPGKLTEDEWKKVNLHPEIGYRILSTVHGMSEMAEYVLAHHERWDGKGYPKGLKGEEIPFASRIIAIADAYDAMTSERKYGGALSHETILEELQKNAGIQFDPKLVIVFIKKVIMKDSAL